MINKQEMIKVANELAQAAFDKKGEDIVIMDMEGFSYLADYYVLVSANNPKLAQSIADNVEDRAEELGVNIIHKEGYREGEWILIDCSGIVLHVFTKRQREFYALEQLWNDAPRVPFEGE